ncbi:MAG TPA: STAS domain-containing protein [Terriglobales bacterium]|nr:STAS domain-containing protein [Terriglobales bacterium]
MIVKRVPDRLNLQQAREFQREVQPLMRSDRPQLVFDFSAVRRMDAAGVDMLLQCMSDVMKHDGDLKLAALSPQAAVVLELTRADRLFEVYDTVSDAVRSFSGFLPNAMRQYAEWSLTDAVPGPNSGKQTSSNVAA